MSIYELPVESAGYPAFDVDVELDGEIYNLDFQWNEREGYWYLSMSDESGSVIVSGRKVVSDWNMLYGVTDPRVPPGVLMAVDSTGEGAYPDLDTLGTRVVFLYSDEEEGL